jgi:predicted deacetylase
MHKKPKSAIAITVLIFLLLALLLFFLRLVGPHEIDDVHPAIPCEEEYLAESDILWVVPLFSNQSIAQNESWCATLRATNKVLGMHGVYHEYNEFQTPRDQAYIDRGIAAFEQCFKKKPSAFKAPQLELSTENAKLLSSNNLKIHGKIRQLTHKVYHCNDTGQFRNWVIELV